MFRSVCQVAAPGVKSTVSDCILFIMQYSPGIMITDVKLPMSNTKNHILQCAYNYRATLC